jgi:hypothetical protein
VGASPGITDDGTTVAFFGNVDTNNDGVGDRPGIFLSFLKPGGSRTSPADRQIVQVAGLPNEFGTDASGNPLALTDFMADSRVGVGGYMFQNPGKTSEVFVTFLAKDPRPGSSQGRETLWVVRVPLRVEQDGTLVATQTAPEAVVSVGDTLQGHTISGLSLYDPINKFGQIAFLANLSDGNQAVFRTTPATDTDGDGLPDYWETVGIDVNEDVVIDYDLAAQ